MAQEDYEDINWLEEEPRPRDLKIDEAKEILLADLFANDPDGVFYQRQNEASPQQAAGYHKEGHCL
jgi:hypothetical protein